MRKAKPGSELHYLRWFEKHLPHGTFDELRKRRTIEDYASEFGWPPTPYCICPYCFEAIEDCDCQQFVAKPWIRDMRGSS